MGRTLAGVLEWEVNTIEDQANDQDWEGLRMFSQQHHISEGARQKAQAYLDNGSKAGLNGARPTGSGGSRGGKVALHAGPVSRPLFIRVYKV